MLQKSFDGLLDNGTLTPDHRSKQFNLLEVKFFGMNIFIRDKLPFSTSSRAPFVTDIVQWDGRNYETIKYFRFDLNILMDFWAYVCCTS